MEKEAKYLINTLPFLGSCVSINFHKFLFYFLASSALDASLLERARIKVNGKTNFLFNTILDIQSPVIDIACLCPTRVC